MLCTGHREFGTNRWKFLSKQNALYFRLCKFSASMMCILIVNPQFNRMHPWCSWEGTLPERCSPGKRCHTFWNRNIVLLPIVLGKVSCVPNITLVNCMVLSFGKDWRETHGAVTQFLKDEHACHFLCSFLIVLYFA